jgi:hypothetical protein
MIWKLVCIYRTSREMSIILQEFVSGFILNEKVFSARVRFFIILEVLQETEKYKENYWSSETVSFGSQLHSSFILLVTCGCCSSKWPPVFYGYSLAYFTRELASFAFGSFCMWAEALMICHRSSGVQLSFNRILQLFLWILWDWLWKTTGLAVLFSKSHCAWLLLLGCMKEVVYQGK